MKRLNLNFLFPLLILVMLLVGLSQQMFRIPPLGKFLDPFTGIARNGDGPRSDAADRTLNGMGVHEAVQVRFDSREVPHIFAANTEDLYYAQGYVTASFRLWQMDFISYASAGRLSEIFKEGFLDYDRNQRRIGILESAKKALHLIEKDSETIKVLDAYTRGVNDYIRQLNYRTLPLEYKLLSYEPERWSNLKSVLVMKYIANTLSGYEEDVTLSNLMLTLGEDKFNRLYPDFPAPYTPVVEDQTARLNPAFMHIKKPDYLDYSFLMSGTTMEGSSYNPKLGSNSWAVSGKKTRSGHPMLCNDPHLNLSLPSIWLEMQLSTPEENVYGVSIPGTPAIIIGFNENIAWGITNGADDVKDWYKLKLSGDHHNYSLDGKWIGMDISVEEIGRRGQAPFYDTIYHTLQGPLVYDWSWSGQHPELKGYALKWELHKPSDEFLTFIRLNKAKNYAEYSDAIRHYSCPVQNFTFACKDNTIAINHRGGMELKQPGEGKFVLDGTKSEFVNTRYIPADSLPHMVNPACDYVVSANQHPTTPGYPYYYNGYYMESRANRIATLLQQDSLFDVQKMEAIQLDNVSSFAVDAVPVLKDLVDGGKLEEGGISALTAIAGWKGGYGAQDEQSRLFDLWWKNVRDYTWDEFERMPFYVKRPDDYVLLDLLRKDPLNDYFDRVDTKQRENARDIVTEAFREALISYAALKKNGSVRWADLNKVNITHLTNIPAFGRQGLPSAGTPLAINAMSSNWGPSWRMIVELGDKPVAYGVYAGGQSGNIGSSHYDDFIDTWNKGGYYRLNFYGSPGEAATQAANSWELRH